MLDESSVLKIRPGEDRKTENDNGDDGKRRVADKHVEKSTQDDQHGRDNENEFGNHVHGRRELSFHGRCLPFKGCSAKSPSRVSWHTIYSMIDHTPVKRDCLSWI